MEVCAFCAVSPDRITLDDEHARAVRDGYPVTQGHTLVVPRPHVASVFDLDAGGQAALWRLVGEVRAQLQADLQTDAFTIGINDGAAAGQTVPTCARTCDSTMEG